ncbi:MAG TPA: PEGA domain-containing protein, partial [Luteitalea sp.]|nr:PEGA domain-containing protein [Luteitalea sp.]
MKKLIRGIVVAVACVAATSILPDLAYAQRGGRGGGGGGGRGGGGGGQVRSGAPVSRAVPRPTYRGGGYRGGYRGGGRQVVYTRGFYGRPLYWGGFGYGAWGGWNSWGPGWWGPGYAGSMWWPGWGWWGGPAMYAPPMAAWGVTSDARFLVQPRNTEVYVDGALAGVVDQYDGVFQSLRLAPGTHQITLYLDGHRRYQADVYVAPGSTLKLRHTMEPLAAGAPADERPSLPERRPADAAPSGVDDPDGPPPPPVPPAALPREPRLRERRPMAEGAAGTLVIRVQPADAEVFIDGQRWQAPPSDGPLEVRVPAGRIKVEVR